MDAFRLHLCTNHRDGRSTKVASMMIVHWRLIFLRRGCSLPYAFVYKCMENVDNFKWLLLWSLLANVAQISCGTSLGQGNERLLNVVGHWPRRLPCPYMVKTCKTLILQNQISPWAYSLHKLSGTGDLSKIAKMMVQRWPLTFFTARSNFLPHAFVWALHLYAKNVENSYFGHLHNPV